MVIPESRVASICKGGQNLKKNSGTTFQHHFNLQNNNQMTLTHIIFRDKLSMM